MKKAQLIMLLILFAAIFSLLFVLYLYSGPEWDLLAHYLNAKSTITSGFWNCFFAKGCIINTQNSAYYFETFRAPLSSAIISLFIVAFNVNAIQAYIVFVLLLFIISILMLSKDFKLNPLIAYAVFLSPYILEYALLSNSTEMLSLSFFFMGLAFLARKSPWSGLFFGFASLSKYILLASFLLLILLWKPKKIVFAVLLFALPIIPWLAVNMAAFGNPIYSYAEIFNIINASIYTNSISPTALLIIFSYFIVFSIVAIAIFLLNSRGKAKKRLAKIKISYKSKIIILYLAIAIASFILIAYKRDIFTQTRFGYFAYGSAELLIASILTFEFRKLENKHLLQYTIAAISIIIILTSVIGIYASLPHRPQLVIWNPDFVQAKIVLENLGYGSCNIVSNDWIYMLYEHVHAFSQFYTNATAQYYPILVFYNGPVATSPSLIPGIENATKIYSNKNFSILLPKNYKCVNP